MASGRLFLALHRHRFAPAFLRRPRPVHAISGAHQAPSPPPLPPSIPFPSVAAAAAAAASRSLCQHAQQQEHNNDKKKIEDGDGQVTWKAAETERVDHSQIEASLLVPEKKGAKQSHSYLKIVSCIPRGTQYIGIRHGLSGVCGHDQGVEVNMLRAFHRFSFQAFNDKYTVEEKKVDPFSLVAEEMTFLGERLRSMVVAEIPKLASAAEYFFRMGVEGKRFRPMVLLLMASSMTAMLPEITVSGVVETVNEQRVRQQQVAEITEMIHVASLLHDDVLDSADTRRGIKSLNSLMGNKLAVLAGDFLLSRASVTLASLKNMEVMELLSKVLEHLVTGEIMQMTCSTQQQCSMEYYMEKTFYKTASLIANSCKSIAIIANQSREVAMLAHDYGRHLGLAFQIVDDILDFTGTTSSLGKGALADIRQGIVTAPLLFAMETQPQIRNLALRKFENPGDVELAIDLLKKTDGLERARQLASDHAAQAAAAINALPPSSIEKVQQSRNALIDVTQIVLTRTK